MADDQAALEEYRQLREEKAADWRLITQTTVATLATSGAVAAAGLSIGSRLLVVLAPVPFYLGVAYMIQASWLQNRLIAFLADRSPSGALNYEAHVIAARETSDTKVKAPGWASAWRWWQLVAVVLGTGFALFPLLVRLENLQGFETKDPGWYTAGGVGLAFGFVFWTNRLSRRVESARQAWNSYWPGHRGLPESSSQDPTPPAK